MKNWFLMYGKTFCDVDNFRGRSTRLEMWNFLINNILLIVFLEWLVGPYSMIANIVIFIISIALTVRRFHDVGLNAWFLIALFIPFVNLFFLVMLYCFKSKPETNQYGPCPYVTAQNPETGS